MPEADNRGAGGRDMSCVTRREYDDQKFRCVWQILVHGKISQNLGQKHVNPPGQVGKRPNSVGISSSSGIISKDK